jgi:hypothetical protein
MKYLKYKMCDKLSIGAYFVGKVKKTLFFTFHFYDSALRFNAIYRFDTECRLRAKNIFNLGGTIPTYSHYKLVK